MGQKLLLRYRFFFDIDSRVYHAHVSSSGVCVGEGRLDKPFDMIEPNTEVVKKLLPHLKDLL